MKTVIAQILKDTAAKLENGTSNLDSEGCYKVLNILNLLENGDQEMTKVEAADYLNVSRATFENYVRYERIPKGQKLH